MTGLVRVIRRVTGIESAVTGPLRRPGHVPLDQQQPGPPRVTGPGDKLPDVVGGELPQHD